MSDEGKCAGEGCITRHLLYPFCPFASPSTRGEPLTTPNPTPAERMRAARSTHTFQPFYDLFYNTFKFRFQRVLDKQA